MLGGKALRWCDRKLRAVTLWCGNTECGLMACPSLQPKQSTLLNDNNDNYHDNNNNDSICFMAP